MSELSKSQNVGLNPQQETRGGWTSASSAAADDLCHGRHNAQKGLPEEEREDSAFGRALHDALAKDDPSALTPEQLTIYEQCVDIRTRKIEEFFGVDAPKVRIIKERRLWVDVLATPGDKSLKPERFKHSGQVDFVARIGSKGLIVEYKALPGDVAESPTNKQLRDQVVLSAGNLMLNEIGTVVIQPLVTMKPIICLYTPETIKIAEQEMFARVRACNNPKAARTAGHTQCKFCLARHNCIEYTKWVTAMAPRSEVVAATPVEQWTPEMKAHFLTMRPAVQQWLDECYYKLKGMLKEEPTAVPGYTLKKGNVVTTINDPQKLFERFVKVGQKWAEQENPEMAPDFTLLPLFLQCVKVGNEDFKTLVRKVTGLKGKALDKQVDELREGLFDSKPNDVSITKDK